jgi:hypothetical protein
MASAGPVSAVFVGAIVVLLAGILVYAVVGVAIESSGIVIYDNFPSKAASLSGQPISISVNNNAPMALPYVTPTYSLSVVITSNTSAIDCVYPMIGDLPCSHMSIDLGRIAQGESKSATVRIQTNGNFTLRVDVQMHFFIAFQVKSKSISCQISKQLPSYGVYHICSQA